GRARSHAASDRRSLPQKRAVVRLDGGRRWQRRAARRRRLYGGSYGSDAVRVRKQPRLIKKTVIADGGEAGRRAPGSSRCGRLRWCGGVASWSGCSYRESEPCWERAAGGACVGGCRGLGRACCFVAVAARAGGSRSLGRGAGACSLRIRAVGWLLAVLD